MGNHDIPRQPRTVAREPLVANLCNFVDFAGKLRKLGDVVIPFKQGGDRTAQPNCFAVEIQYGIAQWADVCVDDVLADVRVAGHMDLQDPLVWHV